MSRRTYWLAPWLDKPAESFEDRFSITSYKRQPTDNVSAANLVSSLCEDGQHRPVLDIDGIGVQLLPSTTPGNWHLYIDKSMPWEDYEKLLRVLAEVGVLEPNYVEASRARGMTFVRKPGVKKPVGGQSS